MCFSVEWVLVTTRHLLFMTVRTLFFFYLFVCLFFFLWHRILVIRADVKHGGRRRRLQICYSYAYSCAIALVLGSKKEKVSAKAQVACYSKSKKNRSLFLSGDVRRCKRRSKKEICLGFSATTVLVRKQNSVFCVCSDKIRNQMKSYPPLIWRVWKIKTEIMKWMHHYVFVQKLIRAKCKLC